MRIAILIALAGVAVLAPAAAPAQPRAYGFEEIATDAAYGFCPLLLAAQFPLDSPQLAERGFSSRIETRPHPRLGEIQIVEAKRREGVIAFGGAAGKFCTIVVTGDQRLAALARLRERMSWTGLDFKPVPHQGATIPGVKVETFKAPSGGQALYVQLIETGGPTPAVLAQLFAMAD